MIPWLVEWFGIQKIYRKITNYIYFFLDSCIDCFYRFDLSFLLSCSGERFFVLYGGGLLGEAL